jgi:hypothetical protein
MDDVSDDSVIVFWTLSIVLSYLKQCFGGWILSPSSGKNLLSLAQMLELVPVLDSCFK